MIEILLWIFLGSVMILALPLQLLGLPGTWILVAGATIFRWLIGPDYFDYQIVITLAVMALIAEALEFLTAVQGARTGPPSRGAVTAAIVGAIAGGIIGAPVLFGLGAIPGMAVGALGAVFIVAIAGGQTPRAAFTTAFEAMIGRLKGTVIKLVIAVAMLAVLMASLVM